ncbi:hypothetical protein TVAG_213150 [Trichomonas vaginalis G3]|uniref:Thioredoxin domain-containing protein n=1 Tax=Trichomonas vaginalis (strain ATCC PRA-98 / G3) TaxID=412133 RepID=A2EEU0_TRIV3|nr:DNAJ protein ERDJ3A family [Trichomonas vaginalis G3]EAY08806.1 hypothetical protein TVAG_213150 [Trichomonas vaginalis G3]KAI5542026.1 DNAJ protein ERDJ3A family [Trichomonas vaginalis G3]|eukprot:XP_001321029.1 hypothetical protein [Trichomonas vaginalis G3]
MLPLLIFQSNSLIYELNEAYYKAFITEGKKTMPWFIMYFTKDCPNCDKVSAEFEKAQEHLDGFISFAYADCNKNPTAVRTMNIRAVPIFMLITSETHYKFEGPYTTTAMISFITEKLSANIDEIDETWTGRKDPMVLLFHRSFKAPMLLTAASSAFHKYNITFAMTRDSDVINAFGKPSLPSYYFYKDGVGTRYKGDKEIQPFIKAISKHFGYSIEYNEL